MQNASPSTSDSATSDMKPALPSMNFRFSDWWKPASFAEGFCTAAVSATPVASSAASDSVSAAAAGWACRTVEQEKVRMVMIADSAIIFLIISNPLGSPWFIYRHHCLFTMKDTTAFSGGAGPAPDYLRKGI